MSTFEGSTKATLLFVVSIYTLLKFPGWSKTFRGPRSYSLCTHIPLLNFLLSMSSKLFSFTWVKGEAIIIFNLLYQAFIDTSRATISLQESLRDVKFSGQSLSPAEQYRLTYILQRRNIQRKHSWKKVLQTAVWLMIMFGTRMEPAREKNDSR